MKKHLLPIFLILLLPAFSCFAGTYYSANDTNSTDWNAAQNINTPCCANTSMTNAQAGDLVYFRGGTYVAPVIVGNGYTAALKPDNNGTAENPITFQAYPDEIPFIDNTINGGGNTISGFGVHSTNYIIWDGFHTKVIPDANDLGKGVILYKANHITVRNCDIEGNLTGQSNNSCIRADYLYNSTIENNKLYDSKQGGGPHHNSNGIEMYHSGYVIIQNNDIWNCDCGIFDKRYGDNNYHRYNHIWGCSYGIHIGTRSEANEGIEAYQNVIRNISSGWAIAITAITGGTGDKFKFYNNTLYDVASGISLNESVGVTNAEIFNNITYTATTAIRTYTGAASFIDYNDYYSATQWCVNSTNYNTLGDWQTASGFDMNATTANPTFEDANGTSPEDFKLQTGSPALTLGVDRQDHDSDGNTTEVIPAGAYITGSETIGYDDGSGSGGSSSGSRLSGITSVGIEWH